MKTSVVVNQALSRIVTIDGFLRPNLLPQRKFAHLFNGKEDFAHCSIRKFRSPIDAWKKEPSDDICDTIN